MLGEARRLMDNFNKRYSLEEKVVALVLGDNVHKLCEELIFYGADVVIYADSPEPAVQKEPYRHQGDKPNS